MKPHASTSSILGFLVVALSAGSAHAETPSWIGAKEISGREAQAIAV
jgi:hypothetical protein